VKQVLKSIILILMILIMLVGMAIAGPPSKVRSKFYDFNEQLIDGEIKKPTTLYTDSREAVKFDRLLRLKKSFLHKLYDTAKDRVFK